MTAARWVDASGVTHAAPAALGYVSVLCGRLVAFQASQVELNASKKRVITCFKCALLEVA